MQETLESVGAQFTSLQVPVEMIGRPPGSQIRGDAAESEPHLAWQSSIGQFIFLESLAQERI